MLFSDLIKTLSAAVLWSWNRCEWRNSAT